MLTHKKPSIFVSPIKQHWWLLSFLNKYFLLFYFTKLSPKKIFAHTKYTTLKWSKSIKPKKNPSYHRLNSFFEHCINFELFFQEKNAFWEHEKKLSTEFKNWNFLVLWLLRLFLNFAKKSHKIHLKNIFKVLMHNLLMSKSQHGTFELNSFYEIIISTPKNQHLTIA